MKDKDFNTRLEVKRDRDGYSVRSFEGTHNRNSTSYYNILGNDHNKIAQILLDLDIVVGLPIEKAVKIYLAKKKKGDWLGF